MDNFLTYQINKGIYQNITQHTTESIDQLYRKIKYRNHGETEQELLDFFHLVLKHARACSSPTVCASHLHNKELTALVLQKVSQCVHSNEKPCYSLIVCMIDLVKNDPAILSPSVQEEFIHLACPLWQDESSYMRHKSMQLCSRIIPQADDVTVFVTGIILFVEKWKDTMTQDALDLLRSEEYTEFFDDNANNFDRETIKLTLHILLKMVIKPDVKRKHVERLASKISAIRRKHSGVDPTPLIFDVCCANDDDTVFLLDTVLTIFQNRRKGFAQDIVTSLGLEIHSLFLYFLYRCGNTHDIIIDLLLENETNFLDFLTRYAAFATSNMSLFFCTLWVFDKNLTDVDHVLAIIAKTILVLERDGFPYDAQPLINRLIGLENSIIAYWEKHTLPL